MKRILYIVSLYLWPTVVLADWPKIPFPVDARIESIGENVRLNGVPMRLYRVWNRTSNQNVIQFYRSALGSKSVERDLLGDRLFAQGLGDYFLTVRVKKRAADLTETWVSVSDARAARESSGRPLGMELPVNSRVLSDMESLDAGKSSRQLVLLNKLSADTNVAFFTEALQAKGLKAESLGSHSGEEGQSRLFKGPSGEARLVVLKKGEFSNVVLTTIQTP